MTDIFKSENTFTDGDGSLRGTSQRYTLFPLRWKSLWGFYKRHEAAFWTADAYSTNFNFISIDFISCTEEIRLGSKINRSGSIC
jgi:hypothetical protein